MGAITDVVKRYAPASYRALCAVTNSYYSLSDLQALADFVQFRLYNTVADVDDEATVWNLNERQLLGALTTLQFIPAAIDYWGDQVSSFSGNTGSRNESESYFDRREELWKLFEKLQDEVKDLAGDLGVGLDRASLPQVSYGDNGREILITSDPYDFGRQYRTPGYYWELYPWNVS